LEPAHQDDLEFMGFQGIVECFHSTEKWVTGVGLRAQTEQPPKGWRLRWRRCERDVRDSQESRRPRQLWAGMALASSLAIPAIP